MAALPVAVICEAKFRLWSMITPRFFALADVTIDSEPIFIELGVLCSCLYVPIWGFESISGRGAECRRAVKMTEFNM